MLGASGTGKTTLGTAFLAQSSKAEPGLHFGFYESPERLISNATELGFDLESRVAAKHLEVIWTPAGRAHSRSCRQRSHRCRCASKGASAFSSTVGAHSLLSAESPDRLPPFISAIFNELRALGVTTLCAVETENLVGPEIRVPTAGMSAITENMVLLRFVEYRARLHRMISIMKVRGSSFDPALREFEISKRGIELAKNFESAERILSGFGTEKPTRVRQRQKEEPTSYVEATDSRLKSMQTVLIVDDEFGVAEVLQSILEDEGYRAVTAINGKQGLARLAEVTPDLVMLDYMMPILDGTKTLEAIRQQERGAAPADHHDELAR